MRTQITNEDLELSVLDNDAAETPIAAQGVASGLSEPRAELIEDQRRGEGAGAASAAESKATTTNATTTTERGEAK
jgi:sulfate adenylyltransferase subunit 2